MWCGGDEVLHFRVLECWKSNLGQANSGNTSKCQCCKPGAVENTVCSTAPLVKPSETGADWQEELDLSPARSDRKAFLSCISDGEIYCFIFISGVYFCFQVWVREMRVTQRSNGVYIQAQSSRYPNLISLPSVCPVFCSLPFDL